MFSISLKRSVATLAVMAGLLAAAVPANAQDTVPQQPRGFAITMLDYAGAPVLDNDAATDDMSLSVVGPGNDKIFVAGTDTTHTNARDGSSNGHGGVGAGYVAVSNGSIELVRIVTDSNHLDTAGLKAGSREVPYEAYQHNQPDLEYAVDLHKARGRSSR